MLAKVQLHFPQLSIKSHLEIIGVALEWGYLFLGDLSPDAAKC